MTVSTEISNNEYTGNGVTTDFDYKFRIFKANQLSVITSDADGDNVITLRLGTDYTVTGANKSAGGKVILTKPLANGHKISIARDIPITQETSFRNQSKFFADAHEDAFDYLTMILQRIWGSLGSLYLKRPNILANWFDAKGYRIANLGKPKRDSDAVDLGTLKNEIEGVNSTILKKEKRTLRVDDMDIAALPKATERAGNVLTFDKDGKPIVVAPASGSAVDVLNKLAKPDGANLIGWRNCTVGEILDRAVYSNEFNTLKEFAEYPSSVKVFSAGEYEINETLHIKCNSLTTDGRVYFKVNSAIVGIKVGGDSHLKLGESSSILTKGSSIIELTGVKAGDVICLWNPAGYSYSNWREYYRQGEFAEVIHVSEGGRVLLSKSLLDTYPIGTHVYKMGFNKCNLSGDFHFNYPNGYSKVNIAMLAEQIISSDLTGLKVFANNCSYAVLLRRGYNISGDGLNITQRTDGDLFGLEYGLYVGNSQSVKLNGVFFADRHACSTSGNDSPCSIVNRFINIDGEFYTSGKSPMPAADWHGNTELSSYSGYMQGLVLSGNKNSARNSIIDAIPNQNDEPSVIADEPIGCDFDLSGTIINNYKPMKVQSKGVVDLGAISNRFTQDIKFGGVFNFIGATINSATSVALSFSNKGMDRKYSFNFSGIRIISSDGVRALHIAVSNGSKPESIKLNGAELPVGATNRFDYDAEKLMGYEITGKNEITVESGSSSKFIDIKFPYSMGVIPRNIQVSISSQYTYRQDKLSITTHNWRQDGFTLTSRTMNDQSINSDSTVEVCWVASW